MADEKIELAYEAIEKAKASGKIKKGTNEVTKAVEKGIAKLVAVSGDVEPKEIVMHIEPLCKEKNIPCVIVPNKEELGRAAGLAIGTSAVAIVQEGDAQPIIDKITSKE